MFGLIGDIIFPNICIGCNSIGANVCKKCRTALPIMDFQHCLVCNTLSINGQTHKICLRKHPYAPTLCISSYKYLGLARKMIITSKEHQKSFKNLNVLIEIAQVQELLGNLPSYDYVIPIPNTKKHHRIINHAEYIAKHISKLIGRPYINILEKTGHSFQKELSKTQRKQVNIIISDKNVNSLLAQKSVLLVDDIATSGSTLMYTAKLLKEIGINEVFCYTLARSIRYKALSKYYD